MGIKIYKPSTPGRRGQVSLNLDDLSKSPPQRALICKKHRKKGRNNRGVITARHRGGGHKRRYRLIDFKRNHNDVYGSVVGIEYDPNRNVHIALIFYEDGKKSYILAPEKLSVGMKIISGRSSEAKVGNCLPLKDIPLGTDIHNIELTVGKGGQIVRAAGTCGRIIGKSGNYISVKLPSKEFRLVHENCLATIGRLRNSELVNTRLGKAGRKRWLGKRPHVRGVVMNPCDHPHGGGEGRAPIGRKRPVTPWGKPALGVKTRKRKKFSNIFILRRRK